ncbi:MAG: MtrB/PioB family decaheme-associated outer membrane protein [Gammaproteobacteria bacterium]|nr:MtrB/PioB family decaheme-associated outer membrane protein [Gammaproteobacteria bacterium]
MRRSNGIRIVALAACGVLSSVSAMAADGNAVDTSRWECKSCVLPSGWEQDYELGVIGVSDTSARFGKYTGLNEDGAYLAADLDIKYWGGSAKYFEVLGTNLGLDSRFLGVEGGKQGRWKAWLWGDELPRNVFDDTATPYTGTGNSLTLPGNWVRAPNTQGMTALSDTLRPQTIDTMRRTLGAGGALMPWQKLNFTVDYRRTHQDGNRLQPGAFLSASTELTQPIDFTTDQLELGVGYAGAAWNIDLDYFGSFFRNDEAGYSWDNPYTTGGVDRGQQSQPPDNDFQQVALSGAWHGPARTTLTGRIATGRMEQSEQFLPLTINPNLTTQPLPRQNLAGKVDTTNAFLRATSSPWRPLRLNAEYRLDDRDNQSPMDTYNYVTTDIVPFPVATNLPFGYQRQKYALDADLRLARWLRIAAGWDRNEVERNLQEREKTEADRLWTKFRARSGGMFDATLLIAHEERDGTTYTPLTNAQAPQNPRMRKFYMADRNRDEVEFRLGMVPTDVVNLGVTSTWAENRYRESELGLQETRDLAWTVDASVAFGDGNSLYGAYTRETLSAEQTNSQTFSDPNWLGLNDDEFDTIIVGLLMPKLTEKLKLNLDYTYANSLGEYGIAIANTTQDGPFPDLKTKLHSVRLTLDYQWRPSTMFRIGYWYEKFDSTDWALEGVQPATINNLLSMGADPFNYDVNTFLVSFIYKPQ